MHSTSLCATVAVLYHFSGRAYQEVYTSPVDRSNVPSTPANYSLISCLAQSQTDSIIHTAPYLLHLGSLVELVDKPGQIIIANLGHKFHIFTGNSLLRLMEQTASSYSLELDWKKQS